MLPAAIASMIEHFVRAVDPHANDMPAEAAKKHGGVPLMGDLGGAWLLRPDGSIWEVEWDSDDPPRPLPEARRRMALAVGAERYPWLAVLLPSVPENARPCAPCKGEGRIRQSANRTSSGLLCSECDALGWKAG
jgi:hypothetical protein